MPSVLCSVGEPDITPDAVLGSGETPLKNGAIPSLNSIPPASLTGIELTKGIAPFLRRGRAGSLGFHSALYPASPRRY